MRLLNEMTPDERRAHEDGKRFCQACGGSGRKRLDRRVSTVIWNSRAPTRFPPRRFVNTRIRVTEEVWTCDPCPTKAGRPDTAVVGLVMDFEHIGPPGEIIPIEPGGQQGT